MPRVPSEAAALVGSHIEAQRQRSVLTQDELAAATGIDSSNLRAYENGRAMPSLQSLVRIADALGIEPGVLLDGLTPELFAVPIEDGRRRTG